MRTVLCSCVLLLLAACTGSTSGHPAASRVVAVTYRTASNAPNGNGLRVTGAHTADFGPLDSICDPNNFSGQTGFMYGVITHQADGARYSLGLWLEGYSGPGTYALGKHGDALRNVSLAYLSLSPADQQSYGTSTGTVVVTSDDGRVARGTLDVQLEAATVPGGFPPDPAIHVTGTWSCPRQQ